MGFWFSGGHRRGEAVCVYVCVQRNVYIDRRGEERKSGTDTLTWGHVVADRMHRLLYSGCALMERWRAPVIGSYGAQEAAAHLPSVSIVHRLGRSSKQAACPPLCLHRAVNRVAAIIIRKHVYESLAVDEAPRPMPARCMTDSLWSRPPTPCVCVHLNRSGMARCK